MKKVSTAVAIDDGRKGDSQTIRPLHQEVLGPCPMLPRCMATIRVSPRSRAASDSEPYIWMSSRNTRDR